MKTKEIIDQVKNFEFPEKLTVCRVAFQTHFHMEIELPEETTYEEAWGYVNEIRKLNKFDGKQSIGIQDQEHRLSVVITWCGHGFPDELMCTCDECEGTKVKEEG
jgi:hypothetical protein